MCIVSNWVNEAQDLMAVTKYDELPNSLIPNARAAGVGDGGRGRQRPVG